MSVCFPVKIPAHLLQILPNRFYNLHPSLLPKYRGPDPIFWQLYYGEADIGISLHQMTNKLDQGKMINALKLEYSHLNSYQQLELEIAKKAAELIENSLCTAHALPAEIDKSQVQTGNNSCYFSWPEQKHFTVPIKHWDHKRVYFFILFILEKYKYLRLETTTNHYDLVFNAQITAISLKNAPDYLSFRCKDGQNVYLHKQCLMPIMPRH